MGSEPSRRNFCSHRAQRNRMTSEDHVKKVHGTSTRQDVFSALPAVGKINGLAYVSNFPLPLPPLVCQASSSLPPEAMAGWPSTSALLEAAQTRFEGANTWRCELPCPAVGFSLISSLRMGWEGMGRDGRCFNEFFRPRLVHGAPDGPVVPTGSPTPSQRPPSTGSPQHTECHKQRCHDHGTSRQHGEALH